MRMNTVVIYRSANNPRIQLELTPKAAREILDGKEKTIMNMCSLIEEALKLAAKT